MFRHIRSKLIAAFAVPLAILVAVAGVQALSALHQVSTVDNQTALASASVGPGGLVQALQVEREYGELTVLAGAISPAAGLRGLGPHSAGYYQSPGQVTTATDQAVAAFEQDVHNLGAAASSVYAPATTALDGITRARSYWEHVPTGQRTVSDYQLRSELVYTSYASIVASLVDATAQVPQQVNDPVLRSGVEALNASLQATEAQWQTFQDMVRASWSTGAGRAQAVDQASQDWGSALAWAKQLASFGNGPYGTAVRDLVGAYGTSNAAHSALAAAVQADLVAFHQGQAPALGPVLAALSGPAPAGTSSPQSAQTSGNQQIAAVVRQRASSLHTSAVEEVLLFGALGALGTVLGLVLVALVSRSISRPLVNLAEQAEELANTTLPATVAAILEHGSAGPETPKPSKVRVSTRDELGLMARALEALNKTAVELAAGQANLRRNLADAFVNLGRRNQNLVTRQLEYISEIELKEADPESLEELFRLDHLATRMRRNAESLLILAGSGPSRQWSAAVPAMDVARAASAEVEDYKRLRLHHFDPAQVTGSVTTDLVHILAELIENSLTFSPPGSPVDIYGRYLEGGYVIVIVDSGIGMSAEDLTVANGRLQGVGSATEIPGRYLGHFVAGRLAVRHGILISLQASHTGGLVARVKIPATLIEDAVPDLSAQAELSPAEREDLTGVNGYALPPASQAPPAQAAPPRATGYPAATGPAVPQDAQGAVPAPSAPAPATAYAAPATPPQAPLPEASVPPSAAVAPEPHDEALRPAPQPVGPAPAATVPAATGQVATGPATNNLIDDYGAMNPDALTRALAEASAAAASRPPSLFGTHDDWATPTNPAATGGATGQPAEAALSGAPADAERAGSTRPALAHRLPAPDLNADGPLAGAPAPQDGGPSSAEPVTAATGDPGAGTGPGAPVVEAHSAAGGVRKLTRRVPGASLPAEDGALRRETPTTTSRNPLGVTGALSQYLSATGHEGRPEKEHN